MKVYIVYEESEAYEGDESKIVRRVFSTEEKALLYMKEENESHGYEFVTDIEEMEVE